MCKSPLGPARALPLSEVGTDPVGVVVSRLDAFEQLIDKTRSDSIAFRGLLSVALRIVAP